MRSWKRLLSASVFSALLAGSALSSNTWYVDVHGTPPGTGAQVDPYTSISYAVDQATTLAGDTVLVLPGNYGPLTFFKALNVRSTDGPAVTRILGDATFGTGTSVIESLLAGFTIEGRVTMVSGAIDQCAIFAPGGYGIFFDYGGVITRCTVVGGGIQEFPFDTDHVLIENTVVLSSGSTDIAATQASRGDGAIRYCRFASSSGGWGWANVGNISADPALWDPIHGYLRLKPGSPCIDAGDPAAPLDADGSRIDMGAFTYDATYAPRPTSYCTAKMNSLGCLPDIGHQGDCSATNPNAFLVRATNIVPNKTGFLFYGTGEASAPFQGGTRCVSTPFKRTPASNSGSSGGPPCSGVLSFDFNARIRSGIDPALIPGRMVYAQYYYRDPNDPAGFGTGLSDGLRFGIAP